MSGHTRWERVRNNALDSFTSAGSSQEIYEELINEMNKNQEEDMSGLPDWVGSDPMNDADEMISDLRAELDAISGLIWAYGPAEDLDPERAKKLLGLAQVWVKERNDQ